jgi:type I restriction enzyme, S subunit
MSSAQVPEGYKQTEGGVIPEDWKVLKLKNIAPLQRGFDLPTAKLKEGDYPVVYSNGVMNYHSKFMVNGPGVVTGRSGTIGNVHYISESYWPHNTALWVTDFINSYPQYIYYLYKFIKLERFGTGSGVPTLNRNDVHDLTVAIPRPEEQHTIAQALSDVDALIASLDKLIAKQRHLKTAAMQQLLTGKMRSPGFGKGKGYKPTEIGVIPEDWEIKGLDTLGSAAIPAIKAGPFGSSLTKDTYVPEGYKVYGQEQVIRGDYVYGVVHQM